MADPIDRLRRALAGEPEGTPLRVGLSLQLAQELLDRFERVGGTELVEEAVRLARWAAGQPLATAAQRTAMLAVLAQALARQAEFTGDEGELAESLAASAEAVAIAPPSQRAFVVGVRAFILGNLHQRTRDPRLLPELVATARLGAEAGDWRGRANLANALINAYAVTGEAAYYDESVALYRQLLGEPDVPAAALAVAFGGMLTNRYQQTLRVEYLREGIAVLRRATADGDATRRLAGRAALAMLGGLLSLLARRPSGEPAMLAEGLALCRRARAGIAPGDAQHTTVVSTLAIVLGRVFDVTRDRDTIDESITLFESLVTAGPSVPVEIVDYAARAHLQRGEVADFDRAAELLRRVAGGDDQGAAQRGAFLARILSVLARAPGRAGLLGEAIAVARAGAGRRNAPPSTRLDAAHAWLSAALAAGARAEADEAVRAAVGLLPASAGARLAWEDRLYHLGFSAGLASAVVAAELALGRPERAVELAEEVRGTLLADAIDPRDQLARLRAVAPELAARLADVRLRLRRAQAPEALAAEFDDLLARARGLDGFADLLAPPGVAELCLQTYEGAIVLVNAHPTRCDAIIIEPGGVRVVPLPALNPVDAAEHADRLAAPFPARGTVAASLAWLWTTVTGPVLAALPAGGRVWWCPVGVMARLPLHAAGTDTVNALDLVVSSYTPTIRALAQARRGRPAGPARALVVAVPGAPGLSELPNVEAETATVARLVPGATLVTGVAATRSRVLAELPTHALAHFACHGNPDDGDPAQGNLALVDGPLTVADLAALDLSGAGLAYLSACHTSGTNDALRDESVHLAGACQLAGFRAVVGSLWAVSDRAAGEIATAFYRVLTADGTRPPTIGGAALALHDAVRATRASYPGTPELWCAHVHVGA